MLIQYRIPFRLLFDGQLDELTKFNALILPNCECLDDAQLAAIRSFVQRGGGLVATEQSGLYDEWRRPRRSPGLKGIIDHQPEAGAYEESVLNQPQAARPAWRKQVGAGRSVYVDAVEFDGPLPEAEPYFASSNRFWRLPRNAGDIAESVHWACDAFAGLEIAGPLYLVATLNEQKERARQILHLINYRANSGNSIENISVKLPFPYLRPSQVTLVSPDASAPVSIPCTTLTSGMLSFTVPQIRTYTVAVIGPA